MSDRCQHTWNPGEWPYVSRCGNKAVKNGLCEEHMLPPEAMKAVLDTVYAAKHEGAHDWFVMRTDELEGGMTEWEAHDVVEKMNDAFGQEGRYVVVHRVS